MRRKKNKAETINTNANFSPSPLLSREAVIYATNVGRVKQKCFAQDSEPGLLLHRFLICSRSTLSEDKASHRPTPVPVWMVVFIIIPLLYCKVY